MSDPGSRRGASDQPAPATSVAQSDVLPATGAHPSHAALWPAPHHMRVIGGDANPQGESGIVTLTRGEVLVGSLQRIDFTAGELEFVPEGGPCRLVSFASVRTLLLTRPITMERIPLSRLPGSLEAHPSNDRQKCVISFNDSSSLEIDVVSVLRRNAGLFLFVAGRDDEVRRCFVPTQAVAHYNIGKPLGKALMDRNALGSEALASGLRIQKRLHETRFGEYLANQGIVARGELEAALLRQKSIPHIQLGNVLVQDGFITAEQRDAALATQAADRHRLLGEILVEMGAVTREDIRHVLVEQLGVPSVNLARFQFDPNAIKAVSADLARKHEAMPLYRTDKRIAICVENPLSWQALQDIEFSTGLTVDPAMAAREDILAAITRFYSGGLEGRQIAELVAELGADSQLLEQSSDQQQGESDNTLVQLVNRMIVDAFDLGASDIHIESRLGESPSRVRFRVDGVLAPYIEVPAGYRAALVSRVKVMCELDISERRRPQDGKIRFQDFGPRQIALRVVTMPTAGGMEDVVMRILAAPRALSLEQLALNPRILAELKEIAVRSFGLMFVCGPTGSGKTTTLHSLLGHINTPERKIWTVEDPVEISQDGLCQVQVNKKLGLTFPEVLRSFLRADPDVIMVGETRDPETAHTVIAASLTGHLVLSTMHTNSAVESIVRLLDFGLDPFNFSDALLGIVGQRLVRSLCAACSTAHVASRDEIDGLAHEYCRDLSLKPETVASRWRSRYGSADGTIALHGPVGCPLCDRSGYKGRMAVHELLVASAAVKAGILARATSAEILHEAMQNGMSTLVQDAIDKILQGRLDFNQVRASCR